MNKFGKRLKFDCLKKKESSKKKREKLNVGSEEMRERERNRSLMRAKDCHLNSCVIINPQHSLLPPSLIYFSFYHFPEKLSKKLSLGFS